MSLVKMASAMDVGISSLMCTQPFLILRSRKVEASKSKIFAIASLSFFRLSKLRVFFKINLTLIFFEVSLSFSNLGLILQFYAFANMP